MAQTKACDYLDLLRKLARFNKIEDVHACQELVLELRDDAWDFLAFDYWHQNVPPSSCPICGEDQLDQERDGISVNICCPRCAWSDEWDMV